MDELRTRKYQSILSDQEVERLIRDATGDIDLARKVRAKYITERYKHETSPGKH